MLAKADRVSNPMQACGGLNTAAESAAAQLIGKGRQR